jgi:hypothetical protein
MLHAIGYYLDSIIRPYLTLMNSSGPLNTLLRSAVNMAPCKQSFEEINKNSSIYSYIPNGYMSIFQNASVPIELAINIFKTI